MEAQTKSLVHANVQRRPSVKFQDLTINKCLISSREKNSNSQKPLPKGTVFHGPKAVHTVLNFLQRSIFVRGLSPLFNRILPCKWFLQSSNPAKRTSSGIWIVTKSPLMHGDRVEKEVYWMQKAWAKLFFLVPKKT